MGKNVSEHSQLKAITSVNGSRGHEADTVDQVDILQENAQFKSNR